MGGPIHDWDAIDPALRALHEEGISGVAIGRRLGMSDSTVRKRLRDLGLRGLAPVVEAPPPVLLPLTGDVICQKRATRKLCAEAFRISEADLIGKRRWRELSIPRQAAFYVLRQRFPEMSYPRIGRMFADRDHSTIIHGVQQTAARIRRDPKLRAVVEALVAGRLPEQHDAHVRTWLRGGAKVHSFAAPAKPALRRAEAEEEAPSRQWCDQCQSNVTEAAAARCRQRFCSIAKAFALEVAA
jgi:hypothetical protein